MIRKGADLFKKGESKGLSKFSQHSAFAKIRHGIFFVVLISN